MTATDLAERPAPTEDQAVTPTLRSTARRVVFWLAIAVVVLIIVGLVAVLSRTAAMGQPLASDNPAPGGSMALVEVLKNQGVHVTATSSLADTTDAVVSADQTTILLYDPSSYLERDQLESLTDLADRIIVVDPRFFQLNVLAPDVARDGPVDGPLTADCRLPAVEKAEKVSGDLTGYRIGAGSDAVGCLDSGDDVYSVVQADDHVTVLGAVGALTNGQIAQDGNAALVLNLLGEHNRLIWYLPSIADLDVPAPPPSPAWLIPAIGLLGLAAVAIAFWRGRRLGPLVVENLPVTVRASETMLGRARLYEKSGARLRALDALRVGSVQRIAKLVGLSRHATLDEIVNAAAALTGRPPTDIRALLVDDVPGNDKDFVRRSDELLTLEQEVARAVRGR
jgi:hypothetical protein